MARRKVTLGFVRRGARNQDVALKRLGRSIELEYDIHDQRVRINRGFVRSKTARGTPRV